MTNREKGKQKEFIPIDNVLKKHTAMGVNRHLYRMLFLSVYFRFYKMYENGVVFAFKCNTCISFLYKECLAFYNRYDTHSQHKRKV